MIWQLRSSWALDYRVGRAQSQVLCRTSKTEIAARSLSRTGLELPAAMPSLSTLNALKEFRLIAS
jgi:hypothetical protein